MKKQARVSFFCAIILVISGCCSVSTRVDLSLTHYTVSAMILELSGAAEQVLNTVNQTNPEVVLERWDVKTTHLPTIHLLLGETNEIQTGKSYIYPFDTTAHDRPVKDDTVLDGLNIRAVLSIMPDQRPRLAIAIEDSKIIKWTKSPAGNRSPVCKVRRMNTTFNPVWGKWQNAGGMAATEKEKGQAFLVRIDKPKTGGTL